MQAIGHEGYTRGDSSRVASRRVIPVIQYRSNTEPTDQPPSPRYGSAEGAPGSQAIAKKGLLQLARNAVRCEKTQKASQLS
jgi:hypothetical protein